MKKFLLSVIFVIAFVLVGCETNNSLETRAFSVSVTRQVIFSPGNLQYTRSTDTWSFASAQYEMIGTDNVTGGSVILDEYGDNRNGTALADKVDLFGWSTSASNFGVSASKSNSSYSGSFVDWGTNKIGNDAPNTWRTLSKDEWDYLVEERNNASSLCGVAQVNGVNGLIFLPDDWSCPTGITFKPGFAVDNSVDDYAACQTFTAEQWLKLEVTGAIFLPAAGCRSGSGIEIVQFNGAYWSSATYDSNNVCIFLIFSSGAGWDNSDRSTGLSVRLVKDL